MDFKQRQTKNFLNADDIEYGSVPTRFWIAKSKSSPLAGSLSSDHLGLVVVVFWPLHDEIRVVLFVLLAFREPQLNMLHYPLEPTEVNIGCGVT